MAEAVTPPNAPDNMVCTGRVATAGILINPRTILTRLSICSAAFTLFVPKVSRETKVGVFPVKAPPIEVENVGAGGGSNAYFPSTGALRIGPQSAGSEPGPACYGRGGLEPTVADFVLGYLQQSLVGGEMSLDVEVSKQAVETVAEKLGIDFYRSADEIYDIVNEYMYAAI
ncbi:hypothetical protein M3205_09690 [Cytobacillus firmus]|uniref:hydantoinase/oxoprolinase family protein n=1 Tax=Cytobacillus firmus TaxID=1399 RepID=UPI00204139CF|nr:hydantoinase/oxoprolinase family protein [Cytobacillus firmus]MCM3706010.1 hypothetical protein [Cytobacillus firmus]